MTREEVRLVVGTVWGTHEVAEEGSIPCPGSLELCGGWCGAIGELGGEWRRRGEKYLWLAGRSALVGSCWLTSLSMNSHLPRQASPDQTIPLRLQFAAK